MSNTKEDFETIYSKSAKSAKQYFVDQSRGKFSPQFDLYGIYTLSSNRATYGGNEYKGNDKGVAKMVIVVVATTVEQAPVAHTEVKRKASTGRTTTTTATASAMW